MRNYNKITPELVADVTNMIKTNTPESIIRRFIRDSLKLGKSRGNEIFNTIKYNVSNVDSVKKVVSKSEPVLETNSKYTFNKKDRNYVVYIKSAGKNIVIPEDIHKGIMAAYVSNVPSDQISVKFGIPAGYITEYKTAFGWRRDGVPITDEDANSLSVSECAGKLLEEKKFEIIQEYNKLSWRRTVDSAKNWELFQLGEIQPFEQLLSKWNPSIPKYNPPSKKQSDYNLLVALSDTHFGCESNPNLLFRKKGHSTNITVKYVREYYTRLLNDICSFNLNINSVRLLSLGDQVHSSNPYSQTTKGTTVKSDLLGEELFEVAFDSMVEFIYNISMNIPIVKVTALKGNHCGQLDLILFKAVSAYFRNQPNITFELISAPVTAFRERNTFCIASHGAHDSIKAKFTPGPKIQSYIQSLIIHSQEKEKGITSRAAFFADLHHAEMKEYNDFTYHLCPSIVRNDEYSDSLGLASRSAQSAFLIDDTGIKSTFNYYFD